MNWYKIDEVATMTGITKRSLRYYEEIGLITPPQRTEGKFRLYSDKDIAQIENVLLAREVLGFNLQELKHFLSLKENLTQHQSDNHRSLTPSEQTEIEQILQQSIESIDQKIAKMRDYRDNLQSILRQTKSQTK